VREAAWPVVRQDLSLSYTQVGLLLSIPGLASLVLEPAIGVLGDMGRRRALVVAGGLGFASALVLAASAPGFGLLLGAFLLMYPSSGAFVSLSQATLMDLGPDSRERNIARWTLAGSVGVAAGPLLFAATRSWRWTFVGLAVVTLVLTVLVRRYPFDGRSGRGGVRAALAALRRREVLRWLAVLELQDLGGDVLYGYLALYFVDVVGVSAGTAALVVAVWTGADLVGNLVLLRVLHRVPGTAYIRATAFAVAVLFPLFQLVSGLWPKLALIGLVGALHSGWYPVAKGRLYAELPGLSGTAMGISTVTGVLGSALPLAVGLLAGRFGLHDAFWLVLLAPGALLVGVPRGRDEQGSDPYGV
jgi:FSR family fosmidomycin resistance protein-like MFS transporter